MTGEERQKACSAITEALTDALRDQCRRLNIAEDDDDGSALGFFASANFFVNVASRYGAAPERTGKMVANSIMEARRMLDSSTQADGTMRSDSAKFQGTTPPADMLGGKHWRAEVEMQMLNAARIVITDGTNIVHQWAYTNALRATAAFSEWSNAGFVDEPDGWVRACHAQGMYYRRRPDADKSKEYLDKRA